MIWCLSQALTTQMGVLLAFNDAVSNTVGGLMSTLAMKKEQLTPVLQSLVKVRHL